jgi:SAM-dependent methyltransferase
MLENPLYKSVGVAFLALAKLKNVAKGYDRARPFSTADIERCVSYDTKVVDEWLEMLEAYTRAPGAPQLAGKRVLELGPGADLGVPLYLLSKGVAQYCSIDAFPLALSAPKAVHEAMIAHVTASGGLRTRAELESALECAPAAAPDAPIRYVVRPDFRIADAFPAASFDLVFSQAAFEHFDDVEDTIRQMSKVAAPGATLIAGIDMQTHSRWLRDKDPLNIYRHSDAVYRAFAFRGMPNRVPASDYARLLAAHGWEDIEMRVLHAVDAQTFARIEPSLPARFRKDETRNLWVMACARRRR